MATDPSPEAARARAELAAALDAIEGRLNVPKRVKRQITDLRSQNPLAFGGAIAAAVAAVGAIGWLIVRSVSRR